jgi:hypothetical protein
MGWSTADIKVLNGTETNLYRDALVTMATARRTVALVRTYGSVQGPSIHAQRVARGKGWLTAGQYDVDLFYDPRWDGQGGLLSQARTAKGDLEDLTFLAHSGLDADAIAERLGKSKEWVRVHLRHG